MTTIGTPLSKKTESIQLQSEHDYPALLATSILLHPAGVSNHLVKSLTDTGLVVNTKALGQLTAHQDI
jgi:hypothetical protein